MTDESKPITTSTTSGDTTLSAQVVDQSKPADDVLTPATKPDASGAFQEPEIAERIDVDHPAVDNNPRKGTKPDSNRIDFNDPTLSAAEAVARNLEEQGMKVAQPLAGEDDHKV